jgi:hypothetical protein
VQKTDDFIVRKLKWKAEKNGLPTTSAFYFDDLSSPMKNHLSHQIEKENGGKPVLLFTKPTKEWTMICSRKVIWYDNTSIISLNLTDIKQILPTAFDEPITGQNIDLRTMKKSKTEWDTIKVIDKQGDAYILCADKGSDLFSLWNILLMAKRFYE